MRFVPLQKGWHLEILQLRSTIKYSVVSIELNLLRVG